MSDIAKVVPQELCYTAPITFVLSTYGIDHSNEVVFGLGQGLAFEFSYVYQFERSKDSEQSDWVSISGSKSILANLKNLYGIDFFDVGQDMTKENVLKLLHNECELGYMPILYLDTYHLKYHKNYLKLHGQTTVVLKKLDQIIEIIDFHASSISPSVYDGTIELNELKEALIIGENEFIEEKAGVLLNRKIKSFGRIDKMKSLEENCYEMLFSTSKFEGIKGIYTFAEAFITWQQWEKQKMKVTMKELYLHIMGRGGPAITRKAYHLFLKEQFPSNGRIIECSDQFELLRKEWQKLAARFFKSFYKEEVDFNKNYTHLLSIAALEKELFTKLWEASRL